MRSRQTFGLTAALAVAALVASGSAQDGRPPRSADSPDVLPAESAANTPSHDGLGRWPDSGAAADPALEQLLVDEAAIVRQADALTRQLEAADSDARRDDVKAKLGDALGKQFDLRQRRHGLEIEALEVQVKKLRELVRKRQENRAEIISRRLDQLVRDSQGLGF